MAWRDTQLTWTSEIHSPRNSGTPLQLQQQEEHQHQSEPAVSCCCCPTVIDAQKSLSFQSVTVRQRDDENGERSLNDTDRLNSQMNGRINVKRRETVRQSFQRQEYRSFPFSCRALPLKQHEARIRQTRQEWQGEVGNTPEDAAQSSALIHSVVDSATSQRIRDSSNERIHSYYQSFVVFGSSRLISCFPWSLLGTRTLSTCTSCFEGSGVFQ